MFTTATGIVLAFVAMLCWGFGDFLIQKSTRKVGDWETLFVISFFGTVILLPFSLGSIQTLIAGGVSTDVVVLIGASIVLFFAALVDFEALKRGKLALVEPIWAFEIPAASMLAYLVLGERITAGQTVLIGLLMLGLILVSLRTGRGGLTNKKALFEKGTVLAFLGALLMGSANFFIGWGSRVTDPVMIIFFTNVFLAVITFGYLMAKGGIGKLISDTKANFGLLMPMTISDNVAWLAYAFSMSLAPIAVATALSESYVILAVLLGLFINKEKIQTHQKVGLILAVISAVVLAVVTGNN